MTARYGGAASCSVSWTGEAEGALDGEAVAAPGRRARSSCRPSESRSSFPQRGWSDSTVAVADERERLAGEGDHQPGSAAVEHLGWPQTGLPVVRDGVWKSRLRDAVAFRIAVGRESGAAPRDLLPSFSPVRRSHRLALHLLVRSCSGSCLTSFVQVQVEVRRAASVRRGMSSLPRNRRKLHLPASGAPCTGVRRGVRMSLPSADPSGVVRRNRCGTEWGRRAGEISRRRGRGFGHGLLGDVAA